MIILSERQPKNFSAGVRRGTGRQGARSLDVKEKFIFLSFSTNLPFGVPYLSTIFQYSVNYFKGLNCRNASIDIKYTCNSWKTYFMYYNFLIKFLWLLQTLPNSQISENLKYGTLEGWQILKNPQKHGVRKWAYSRNSGVQSLPGRNGYQAYLQGRPGKFQISLQS